MLKKEIRAEAIYVLTLCVIVAWFFMVVDIKQRIEDYALCDQFICHDVPVPTGWEDSMYKEPKYKPKYRAVKSWRQ